MEEDIKILEDYIAFKRQFVLLNDETERYEAIENLIKGYRELEEDNKILKANGFRQGLYEKDCGYIPKSKIKEILCRLNISDIEPWSIYKVNGEILFDLEKLLGE